LKDQENNQYKLVYFDDILFNPMNLRFGAIAISEIPYQVLVSAYYNIITKSVDSVDVKYYCALFKTTTFNNFYERIAIGSLIEKKRVHLSNFFKLQIPQPSLQEQAAIAQVLQTADQEILFQKSKLEKLKEQKKGMTQILLTGQKRLTNQQINENNRHPN
jgi:type I restriction enzyme, S subunit